MRCLTCHYPLLNLTEHRCPECGAAFDPNNPFTFDSGFNPPRWEVMLGWFMLLIGLLTFLLFLVSTCSLRSGGDSHADRQMPRLEAALPVAQRPTCTTLASRPQSRSSCHCGWGTC